MELLAGTDVEPTTEQLGLLGGPKGADLVYYAGDPTLLELTSVAVVGTRKVSQDGTRRAARLARELVAAGVVVTSGLAMGVDTVAMTAALDAGGRVVGVIGTPLDRATPSSNGPLQEIVYREHLLISPFAWGSRVYRSNFPRRNRVMAQLTSATVVVEASETSGTLHQARECQRLGRWLFLLRSLVEDPSLTWPASFLRHPKTRVLDRTQDLLDCLGDDGAAN